MSITRNPKTAGDVLAVLQQCSPDTPIELVMFECPLDHLQVRLDWIDWMPSLSSEERALRFTVSIIDTEGEFEDEQ